MSSRPQFTPYPVITDGNLTLTLTSKVTIIQKLSLVSYAFSWSGTSPVASVTVQVSNDYAQDGAGNVSNAGHWATLPLSATTQITGNTGTGFIDIDANAGYALRVVVTPTSGTGTLQVVVSGKVA